MDEKILPVTLNEGDNARVESIAGGQHIIRVYRDKIDENGNAHPNTDHGAFGEDGVGKGAPLILDDDTTLVVKSAGKPAKLTIPANLDINGFKPRIRFDNSILMEDGSFIVDAGSKARPRIDISHVVSLDEDKNTHAWRLTTQTGGITRTYVIEKGAAGIELQAPGQDKPIVIERNRSLAETQKRLAPLAPPKKEPQQEMPRQPAVPAENRDAVSKELAAMNEKINKLGERVRQWSAYEHLSDVFAPVKKASYRFSSKDNPDTAAFGEALDTAIGKLEKLVQEKEQSGKRDAPAEDMIKKLQDVKKDTQHIHDLRAPGGKTGMLPKPAGMSEKQLTEAIKAVTLPADNGAFVIHTKPAATLSPVPNLGGPARTV